MMNEAETIFFQIVNNPKRLPLQGEPQTVEKPVIASQCAHWRGNPFSKMFCFTEFYEKMGAFLGNGFPRPLRVLGMTYYFRCADMPPPQAVGALG